MFRETSEISLGIKDSDALIASKQAPVDNTVGDVGIVEYISGERIGAIQSTLERSSPTCDQTEMDTAYFCNADTVRKDLEAFAQSMGLDSVDQLSMHRIEYSAVLCNGETCNWQRYLNTAARALGVQKKTPEGSYRLKPVLIMLKKIAQLDVQEFPVMDNTYFNDKEKVSSDLLQFTIALGEQSPDDLTASKGNIGALCSNGETVKWTTYLRRASSALGLIQRNGKGKYRGNLQKALEHLKRSIGLEITVHSPMNIQYFENTQTLQLDLSAYAIAAGVEGIVDLNSGKAFQAHATCCNGETLQLSRYVIRAGRILGLADSYDDARTKFREILDHLKRSAGVKIIQAMANRHLHDPSAMVVYSPMDTAYFSNIPQFRTDLLAFAFAMGCKSIAELSGSSRVSQTTAFCVNGEEVSWEAYLHRASRALDIPKRGRLVAIKKFVCIEVPEEPDENYFADKRHILADLDSFAAAMQLPSTAQLNTRYHDTEAVCENGEIMKWNTYLRRAAKALGYIENPGDSWSKREIVDVLLRTCDVDVVRYPPMERSYFENSSCISADLIAFATAMGLDDPGFISTSRAGVTATCCTGESVKWQAYMHRAARGLGFAVTDAESRQGIAQVVAQLKIIAGIAAPEPSTYAQAVIPEIFTSPRTKQPGKRGREQRNRKSTRIKYETLQSMNTTFLKGEAFEQMVGVALGLQNSDELVIPQYCLYVEAEKGIFAVRADFKVGETIYEVKWGNAEDNIDETRMRHMQYIDQGMRYQIVRLQNPNGASGDQILFSSSFDDTQKTEEVGDMLCTLPLEIQTILAEITLEIMAAAESSDADLLLCIRNHLYAYSEEANDLKGKYRIDFFQQKLSELLRQIVNEDERGNLLSSIPKHRYSTLLAHFEHDGQLYRGYISPADLQSEQAERYQTLYYFDGLPFVSRLDRDIAVMIECSDVGDNVRKLIRGDDFVNHPIFECTDGTRITSHEDPNAVQVQNISELKNTIPFSGDMFEFGEQYIALEDS
ncbi:MAG: hypothetical protein PHU04_02990 [Candidatus Peribacteraceae bacterium]|nr:hypothetical protein [Candidatus Peribacteraceae bacterium]